MFTTVESPNMEHTSIDVKMFKNCFGSMHGASIASLNICPLILHVVSIGISRVIGHW